MSLYSDLNAVFTPYANKIKQNEIDIRTAMSLSGGAPIVVGSTSAMTDTDQIYVLSTDGRWYYHNGSAWVAGGEYGAADGSVTTNKLADGAVTTAKIADGAVTGAKLADGTIQTAKIANGAITQAKIANGAITPAKLDPNISFEADDELDVTSTNAVQNKVVARAINEINDSLGEITDLKYTLGNNIISSIKDGYVVLQSNGNESKIQTYSIASAPVDGDSWYLINPYAKLIAGNNCFAFYDENGMFIKLSNSFPYSAKKYKEVNESNREYLVLAPENASLLKVSIKTADSGTSFIKKAVLNELDIENLVVHNRNLDSNLKTTIQQLSKNDVANMAGMTVSYGQDITSETKTGYAIIGGKELSAPNFSVMTAEVEPYKWYQIYTYIALTGNNNILAFFDSNGNLIKPSEVYPNNAIVVGNVGSNGRIYFVCAPERASVLKTTVYADSFNTLPSESESSIKLVIFSKYNIFGATVREGNLEEKLLAKVDKGVDLPTDIVCKPYDFSNKSLVVFGDSIAYGYGLASLNNSWNALFASKFGMTRTNSAQSGTTIANGIYNTITSYSGSPDFIFIAGGTNDYNQGVPVGEYGDEYSDGTFYGALDGICQYLSTNCPNAEIFFFTPIPYLNTTGNEVAKLKDYSRAIFEVAIKYGFNVVRFDNVGFPENISAYSSTLYKDNIHPNESGHRLMYRSLCGKVC